MTDWKKWARLAAAGPRARRPKEQDTAAPTEPLPDDQEEAEPGDQHDEDQAEEVQEDEGDERAWWSTTAPGQPDPSGPQTWTVSPGVQVTINQPPQAPPTPSTDSIRRILIRRWIIRHALGAGMGWTFGLYQSMSAFLNAPDRGGAAAGLALAGMAWLFAEFVTDRLGRFLPAHARRGLLWAARIPFSTALLATALYAPNAVL